MLVTFHAEHDGQYVAKMLLVTFSHIFTPPAGMVCWGGGVATRRLLAGLVGSALYSKSGLIKMQGE